MRPFVHDLWSSLSHKSPIGSGTNPPGVVSWVPLDDRRRLAAYRLLAAMRDNVSRYYLPDAYPDDAVAKYREYGDAARLLVAARTSLLGDEQTLVAPALDDVADEQLTAEQKKIQAALDWMRQWAVKERLWLKMSRAESDAIGLGDGVYTLGWSTAKNRPKLRQWDPGFYFPDRDDLDEDGFPRTHHLAWEELNSSGRPELHRMTWRLGPIRPALDPDREYGELRYAYTDDGRPVPQDGDRLDSDGFTLSRTYAWDNQPSRETCHFSYGVWDLAKVNSDLFDLSDENVRWQFSPSGELQRERDLRLDFVPVLHLPNVDGGDDFFGQSVLALVAQLLDDLNLTNTDLAESGALVGSATLVTKGATPVDVQAGPGARLDLPQTGTAQYLDTSKNLDALLKLLDSLKDRLSENSRISNVTLGRVDAGNAPSGLALALSFSPEEGLVRELRQVRDEKNPLLLKMALRMAQGAGVLPTGPTPELTVQLGSFKPSDQQQAIEAVARGLESGAMSIRTAVLTLQQAGFPIDDAEDEVGRIHRDQASKVATLLELGPEGEALIWKWLGLQAPEELPAPPDPDDDGDGGS